jgi:hypothetical protein
MSAEPRPADQIGDELYQLPPPAFTTARDEAVARAKAEGDTATAAAVAAMKRPSVAAWLVNLVALRSPESVDRLVALGETIRSAQSGADPTMGAPGQVAARLRELASTRRAEMGALLATVEQLAIAAGATAPSKGHLSEVEATISAAMADDEAARTVRSGRLVKPLAHHGFGDGGFGDGGFGGGLGGGGGAGATAVADPQARRRQVRERHDGSLRRLDDARQALLRAQDAEAGVTERLRSLVEQRDKIQQQLAQAGEDVRLATRDRLAAQRAVAAAERDEVAASRALSTLRD